MGRLAAPARRWEDGSEAVYEKFRDSFGRTNVTVNCPEVKAPDVHVTIPEITVKAPDVHVGEKNVLENRPPSLRPGSRLVFDKDADGGILSARIVEEVLE